ncbi:MAG: type III-A CRISPR-associated RAMP protein Csm3 [Bacteroidetes bacterium]|nr:type III-A CRISPR-associated RAMP protein Csm3 [Bacteroidota bacterium]
MKLIKKIFINGKIELITGIHIGGSSTALDIGGIDSNVIKDANGIPYIPGSSIKGKMRSLLEMKYSEYTQYTGLEDNGKVDKNRIYKKLTVYDKLQDKNIFSKKLFQSQYNELFEQEKIKNLNENDLLNKLYEILEKKHNEETIKLFGSVAKESDFKTRLIVRDAFLDENILKKMNEKTGEFSKLELDHTEGKWENTIDRLTSEANPRQLERVPSGAIFNFSIVFNFFEKNDKKLLKMLVEGMHLIEDDYLGGSGSRGYGQIFFKDISVSEKTSENYEKHEGAKELLKDKKLNEIVIDSIEI